MMLHSRMTALLIALIAFHFSLQKSWAEAPELIDYSKDIAPIFTRYCAGCHNDTDNEGYFSIESYESLQEGIENEPVIQPKSPNQSLLWKLMAGIEYPVMPPEGEPTPSAEELALIKRWIEEGAIGPSESTTPANFPSIESKTTLAPITSLAISPVEDLLAIGRFQRVELLALNHEPPTMVRELTDLVGKVSSVRFSPDGQLLVTTSGIAGVEGIATLWDLQTGERLRDFKGHRDMLFDAEISPNGQLLATCSYDRQVIIWDIASGEQLQVLTGHNGAVYDVAFHPSGTILATASADDTCKLWRVSDGERLDTLSQPLKESTTVVFSPDNQYVLSAGADHRIRVWKLLSTETPQINPQIVARFAHEAPIVQLAYNHDGSRLISVAEDRTIKFWETRTFTEVGAIDPQPSVAMALAVSAQNNFLIIGRLDGTWEKILIPATTNESSTPSSSQTLTQQQTSVQTNTSPAAQEVALPEVTEQEPNQTPAQAQTLQIPGSIRGVIDAGTDKADEDCFRFHAKAGEEWIIEVNAARSSSRLDSFIEVLTSEGAPIERVQLQAVLDSYFTFRGKDGNQTSDFRLFSWEEMDLNQYLYANGEVVKLWRFPRGPDSGFDVFPGRGQRWGYFGTSGLAHALGEPCYLVEAHPPEAELIPNGLPIFKVYYENDDDSRRELGKDSKLFFTAPADADYVVRLRDIRGEQGQDYTYQLTIRKAHPNFAIQLRSPHIKFFPGRHTDVEFFLTRHDELSEPIRIEARSLPEGVTMNLPLTVQEDQLSAVAVMHFNDNMTTLTPEQVQQIQLVAVTQVDGQRIEHPVAPFTEITAQENPLFFMEVHPASGGEQPVAGGNGQPWEFVIHPGETIMLKVAVERYGHDGEILIGEAVFGGEEVGRNLPHGVYVDNLGLSGLIVLPQQNEGEFFITAANWVPEQTRMFHLKSELGGSQATLPVILHVRPRSTTSEVSTEN